MKKIIVVLILISVVSYGKILNIGKLSGKLVGKNIDRVSVLIKKSPYTKNMPQLKLSKAVDPKVLDLVTVGSKISKKGNFEYKLIDKTDVPLDVIREYAKHGDSFLDTTKEFSKRAVNLPRSTYRKLAQQFDNMPKIEIKSAKIFNDKMIETLKYTGAKGWKASQELYALAKQYPKSTAVTGLIAWYAYDPESFLEQKDKLIAHINATVKESASDATKLTLGVSSGIADGFMSVAKEKLTISNVFILLLALLAFIGWKLRSYIKRYFHIKLENGLEKTKKNNNKNEEG